MSITNQSCPRFKAFWGNEGQHLPHLDCILWRILESGVSDRCPTSVRITESHKLFIGVLNVLPESRSSSGSAS